MYIVIRSFSDRQFPIRSVHTKSGDIPQAFHVYKPGDIYPAPGAPLPTMVRIRELATDENLANVPLIQWVPDPEPGEDTGTEAKPAVVTSEDAEKPAEKPKRARGKKVQKDGDK